MHYRIAIPLMVGILVAAAVAMTMAAQGTGQDSPVAASRTSADTLTPGQALPAATGKVLLSFVGPESVQLDRATLDRMPQSTLEIFEPFERRDMTFTGVRIADLLPIVGVDDSTPMLAMRALDDYAVELDVADLIAADAVLATRADGEVMRVAQGGPVRLVFPEGSELAANTDNWIWSVNKIKASR